MLRHPALLAAWLAACAGGAAPPVAPVVDIPSQPAGSGRTPLASGEEARELPRAVELSASEARRPNDRVLVEWQGSWWPAVLVERRDGQWLVHYEGYGSEWDERVGDDRIRDLEHDEER